MTALRLAFRNLRRNRRRTILTGSALAVGLLVTVVMTGLLDGIDRQSINNLIAYDLASMKAFTPGYLDEDLPGLELTLSDPEGLLESVLSSGDVAAATLRLEMSGMLIKGAEEMFVRVVGVDPVGDREVFSTLDAVADGRSIHDQTPVVLVGDRLARDVGIQSGDLVTLLVRSAPGALNLRTLPVAGILATGHPKVDGIQVIVPLALARDLALLPGGATEIAVRTSDLEHPERAMTYLTTVMPSVEWRNWQELGEDFIALSRMKRTGNLITIGILVLLAAVAVMNTMVMAVHERVQEIGALRALGFTRGMVGRIFLYEGLLIGVGGGLVAVVLGSALVAYLGHVGISLAMYGDMDIGYPIRDAMYPMVNPVNVVAIFIFGLVVSLLASWSAAHRASRGQIVRALREGML